MHIIDEMKPSQSHMPVGRADDSPTILDNIIMTILSLALLAWALYCTAYTDGRLDEMKRRQGVHNAKQ